MTVPRSRPLRATLDTQCCKKSTVLAIVVAIRFYAPANDAGLRPGVTLLPQFQRIEFLLAQVLLLFVRSQTQELRVRNTGDFDRILKRHKDAFARAHIGRKLQKVLAFE